MFSFGNYYQNPILQANWNPYFVSFDPTDTYNLPSLFTHGIPRYDSENYNIFAFTPSLEFPYIPPANFHLPNNPFAFLDYNTTPTNTFRPYPLDDPIPYQTGIELSNNPFAFLNQETAKRTNGVISGNGSKSIRTRKVGNRVAQEVLPGKEVLTIGKGIKLDSLKQDMKVKLVQLSEKASSMGYTLVVSDAFRTHQQQIDAKRRKPKLAATPGKSPHEYGAGIDIALYDKNGKQVNIANLPEFSNYAKSLGLTWGNDWNSKKEPWHFELANWRSRSDIAPEYRRYNNASIA